jgi:DNA phosphorothioation-associated putative methyltransferase
MYPTEAVTVSGPVASQPGKLVGGRRYIHVSVIETLDATTRELIQLAATTSGVQPGADFNVVRIDNWADSVALLSYPRFFEDACPSLSHSWNVRLKDGKATYRTYQDSFNPPVLHRKELLLASDDPHRAAAEQLTKDLEALGFFEDPVRIGFKLQWERLLREAGFRLNGNHLVPIGNDQGDQHSEHLELYELPAIARHLTALTRQNFSAPIQILQRHGYLDGSRTLFDYGCGRGDDLRGLIENGIQALGWDPYYSASTGLAEANIVNLGFVINVIEDPVERREALIRAFSLAKQLLVVSVMLTTDNASKGKSYADGVLTSRITFQKYFTQTELREYVADTLHENPISVAPGICFVFKDKVEEQRFQLGRYRVRMRVRPLTQPKRLSALALRPRKVKVDLYAIHEILLASLWAQCLELGREPHRDEIPNISAIEEAVGSLAKALRILSTHRDSTELESARTQRTQEITVFLALQQFQRAKPYKTLETRLQRDIRAFFGDYFSAQQHAREFLFQLARPELINESCQAAAEQGIGWFEPSHSFQLHSSLVGRLPALLRAYIGCGAILYGDVDQADVVKIHIRSGKVSFMRYDDFWGRAIPKMVERVKINLRTLGFELYQYGDDYPCPPLYVKSRYMHEELSGYAEQLAFDEALQNLKFDLSGYGPSEAELHSALDKQRRQIVGFRLERSTRLPNLDDSCGRFLTYRQLIECGETQRAEKLANVPTEPDTYTALFDLATLVLDPAIEYFGSIELTYGFCSSRLAKKIHHGIAPKVDQHAAHELQQNGLPICPRLGAAVDFLVRDENMRLVAEWIRENTPYDRLYYYGENRPIHVSYGPERKREFVEIQISKRGRRIPRVNRAH